MEPPVTLDEFRAYINVTETDGHDDDEAMWRSVLSATSMVEAKCGPVRPVTRTDRVAPSCGTVTLPVYPVLSVTAMIDASGNAVDVDTLYTVPWGEVSGLASLWSPYYAVTYQAGWDPIPPDLMEAVLSVAGQLWESQRGPGNTNRYTGMGGDEQPTYRGFAWPNRAMQLIQPYVLAPLVG